jgi:hypothetical protein
MSAQVIAALRRRADALEDEAVMVQARGELPASRPHPRSAGTLAMLAAEFRALADEIKGQGALEPDKRGGGER